MFLQQVLELEDQSIQLKIFDFSRLVREIVFEETDFEKIDNQESLVSKRYRIDQGQVFPVQSLEEHLLISGNAKHSFKQYNFKNLLWCFEPEHNLLFLAHRSEYVLFNGINCEDETNFESAVQFSKKINRAVSLRFEKRRESILDNEVKAMRIRNMRLYLEDSEYSMLVFTINVT